MCNQQRIRPACAYAQSGQSLCKSLEYSMTVQLLAEQHFEFLSLKGGCTGWSESTLVKRPHCSKSHVTAHIHFKFVHYQTLVYPLLQRYFKHTISIVTRNKTNNATAMIMKIAISQAGTGCPWLPRQSVSSE